MLLQRPDNWQDRRQKRSLDDTDVLLRIHAVIDELPTYGYRQIWALLHRQSEAEGMGAVNAKRVYRIMHQNMLLPERRPSIPPSKRARTGTSLRWCK